MGVYTNGTQNFVTLSIQKQGQARCTHTWIIPVLVLRKVLGLWWEI